MDMQIKNLYEDHVYTCICSIIFKDFLTNIFLINSKRTWCILVHLYVHHPCYKSRFSWHFKVKIPSQGNPTCIIIGPLKSLSYQEHAGSNMAFWEQRGMLGIGPCSQDAEDRSSSSPSSSTTTWYWDTHSSGCFSYNCNKNRLNVALLLKSIGFSWTFSYFCL